MPHDTFPTFEVSAVDALPEINGPRKFDVVGFTDFLLTQFLRHDAGLLHSDFRSDDGRWRMLIWSAEEYGPEKVVAVSPQKAHFRAVLAHLGGRFMDGQLYGGFAEGFFRCQDTSRYFALYMANDSLRGYWIRLYMRAA